MAGTLTPPRCIGLWIAEVAPGIGLVVGDLALSSRVEDELSSRWPDCLERKASAFRVITAFWRLLAKAAAERQADPWEGRHG